MKALTIRIATVAEIRRLQAAQRAAATDTAVQRYLHLPTVVRAPHGRYAADDDGSAMSDALILGWA